MKNGRLPFMFRCPYAKPNCEICFGTGYVCGRHRLRVWLNPFALRLEHLVDQACQCSNGVPCRCITAFAQSRR